MSRVRASEDIARSRQTVTTSSLDISRRRALHQIVLRDDSGAAFLHLILILLFHNLFISLKLVNTKTFE